MDPPPAPTVCMSIWETLTGKAPDHGVGGHQRLEIPHEAHVGGGAAHVVGDEVADARGRAHEAGLAHPARRPREDGLDGQAARGVGGHHAAARGDREHAVRVAGGEQALLQRGEIALHQRLEVGVEHGGREALELAVLGHHVRGAGDGQSRRAALDRVGDEALVGGVEIGVEQADRHRLRVGGERAVERALDGGRLERRPAPRRRGRAARSPRSGACAPPPASAARRSG